LNRGGKAIEPTIDVRFIFAYYRMYSGHLSHAKARGGFIVITVTTHHTADTVILRCQGRLVRGEESSLLCVAVQEHGKDVVVDLEGVTAIDAAGIGALLSLQAAGIYLRLVSPTEPVWEVLRLTGLEKVFEVVCERSSEDGARDFASAELYIGESKVAALG